MKVIQLMAKATRRVMLPPRRGASRRYPLGGTALKVGRVRVGGRGSFLESGVRLASGTSGFLGVSGCKMVLTSAKWSKRVQAGWQREGPGREVLGRGWGCVGVWRRYTATLTL